MRDWKKWVLPVAALCGILVLPVFAGREKTAQEEVEAALTKLQRVESMEATMTMDMEVELLRLKWSAQTTLDMVTFRDPMKIRADMMMDLGLFGSSELQVYARETEEAYQLFVNDGKRWNDQEVQADQLKRYDGKKMMETYLGQLENLVKDGEEKLFGGMADRYIGVVHNDGLKKVLLDTGSVEMLLKFLEQDMLKPIGQFLRRNEEMIPELMDRAEDMEVVLWIDRKTGYPVQCSMDITRMVNAAVEKFLEADADGEKSGGSFLRKATTKFWSQVKFTKTQILIQCEDFNNAEDFQIPMEALEEEK